MKMPRKRMIKRLKTFIVESSQILIKTPQQATSEELQNFHDMLIDGGEVLEQGLMNRIKSAKLLGFIYEDDKLVSIKAIKKPLDSYKEKVFKKADVSGLEDDYPYESGYAYTIPAMRGKGLYTKLSNKMFNKFKESNFVTTHSKTVMKVLTKHGYKKLGKPYTNKAGTYKLTLFGRKLN